MARTGDDIHGELLKALKAFDWKTADALAEELVCLVLRNADAIGKPKAREALDGLRRKTRFRAMSRLAQALLVAGLDDAKIRRLLAQAWIDQGDFKAAELMLTSIRESPGTLGAERTEAAGLTGRLYKQLYVECNREKTEPQPGLSYLQRSIQAYREACDDKIVQNHWPSINMVATLARGRRDKFPLADYVNDRELATAIRDGLLEEEEERGLDLWQRASLMESHIALGDTEAAVKAAGDYAVADGADAFEYASTIRQMEEVWQLTDTEDPGKRVLPILRAALLASYGGGMKLSGKDARSRLEAVHGSDGFQSVEWYRNGLDRCRSIARIVKGGGIGIGTAWLVEAQEFYPGEKGLMLLTNAHVISPQAVAPEDAFAQFQMEGMDAWEFDGIFDWSSAEKGFDFCFLKLKKQPNAPPLPIAAKKVAFDAAADQRVFVIGHPYGSDLAFSLQDSLVVGSNQTLLHYRTPTTGGSSGSPVFESQKWAAVALHHAGGQALRLDGRPGIYDANEGISIHEIRDATRKGKLS